MKEHLNLFCESINNFVHQIDEHLNGSQLRGIGFITTDDLAGIVAFYLIEGDLPEDCELYLKYSPVEWPRSDSNCFEQLGNALENTHFSVRRDTDYEELVKETFDLCAAAVQKSNLYKKFGNDLYITFGSADPSEFMLKEEERFVSALNTQELLSIWREEFM